VNEEGIFQRYVGLLKDTARGMTVAYHCYFREDGGKLTAYTETLLHDLESEGELALLECIRNGRYDPSVAELSTYALPFIKAAMRRFLETNLGVYALSRERMTLVRKAQRLYRSGKSVFEISNELGVPESIISECTQYATHFFSVYDLPQEDEETDPYDWLEDTSARQPEEVVRRRIQAECLKELFFTLLKREQDVLGKLYGVFGYPKTPVKEIAMYHMIKEDGVEKARQRALTHLRERYPSSKLQLWSLARKAIRGAEREWAVSDR